jgi:hypothetical protein
MKRALMVIVAMMAASAFGQNIYVSKSQEKTALDLPFSYEAEKTVMDGNRFKMIGTVKNTGQSSYQYVKVTFTASKGYGTFIARDFAYTEPNDIGPGQVGYIDTTIDVDGVKPDKIEWTVTGRAD